jgi:hypothetical protein
MWDKLGKYKDGHMIWIYQFFLFRKINFSDFGNYCNIWDQSEKVCAKSASSLFINEIRILTINVIFRDMRFSYETNLQNSLNDKRFVAFANVAARNIDLMLFDLWSVLKSNCLVHYRSYWCSTGCTGTMGLRVCLLWYEEDDHIIGAGGRLNQSNQASSPLVF